MGDKPALVILWVGKIYRIWEGARTATGFIYKYLSSWRILVQMNQHLHVNKTNFHMKAFAPGLALKQRWKATRKSPIVSHFNSMSCVWACLHFTAGLMYLHLGFLLPDSPLGQSLDCRWTLHVTKMRSVLNLLHPKFRNFLRPRAEIQGLFQDC